MQGELKILAKNKINLSSFTKISELNKSYQEGIYSDTPQNRKLGRVGMTYSAYAEKMKNPNKEEEPKKEQTYEPSEEEIKEYEKFIPIPSVNERWDTYGLFCNMVASGVTKSMVSFGTGGVGKTYTLMQELSKLKLKEFDSDYSDINHPEEFDYVKITGSASGVALYKALFEYNNKLIIFDDCDSVLKDSTAVNILKGALDSTGDGTISYSSSQAIKTDKLDGADFTSTGIPLVPNRFKFKGKVIFISNLKAEDIPQPLIDSRCLSIDLSMTKEETIERINTILPNLKVLDTSGKPLKVSKQDKIDALTFLDKYKDSIREGKLNARTLGNIIKIIHSSRENNIPWQSAALALLSN